MLEPAKANVYTDFSQFSDLKLEAKNDPEQALKEIARQFESYFVKQMLDSMRQASFGDPLFDSSNSEMYRDMYDNQIALSMTEGQGIGLADTLVQQMRRYIPGAEDEAVPLVSDTNMSVSAEKTSMPEFDSHEDFVNELMPYAERAAEKLGVAPHVLIAQAALETGWGKKVLRHPDGSSSCNLFNIKADQRWDGNTVTVSSLEYSNGEAKRQVSAFRSYDSIEQSFDDYVAFIQSNPRYQQALLQASDPDQYITQLQHAGYATDPNYANKVINIMQREVVSAPYSEHLSTEMDDEPVT